MDQECSEMDGGSMGETGKGKVVVSGEKEVITTRESARQRRAEIIQVCVLSLDGDLN